MDLFVSQIVWAGVQLSKEGVAPDMEKVSGILWWPTPKTAREILALISTASYFCPCIPGFASIAKPLHALTRGVQKGVMGGSRKRGAYKKALTNANIVQQWGQDQEVSFALLKATLTTAPVLKHHQHGVLNIIGIDVSKHGFAAFLAQWIDENGQT